MLAHEYISTADTTSIKSAPGILSRIVITGGTAGDITVYDGTASDAVVASFDSGTLTGTYDFGISLAKGLTVVTAAATELTVIYE